jgi:hypothetical protein
MFGVQSPSGTRLTHQFTQVEHLAAFCDVRQQNIHEWMLAVWRAERKPEAV